MEQLKAMPRTCIDCKLTKEIDAFSVVGRQCHARTCKICVENQSSICQHCNLSLTQKELKKHKRNRKHCAVYAIWHEDLAKKKEKEVQLQALCDEYSEKYGTVWEI